MAKKGKLEKAFDHMRAKLEPTRPKKKQSIYLWGRKKGAELGPSEEYRDGWDRIFGKNTEPQDFDNER